MSAKKSERMTFTDVAQLAIAMHELRATILAGGTRPVMKVWMADVAKHLGRAYTESQISDVMHGCQYVRPDLFLPEKSRAAQKQDEAIECMERRLQQVIIDCEAIGRKVEWTADQFAILREIVQTEIRKMKGEQQ